jgi:hypothetical protein
VRRTCARKYEWKVSSDLELKHIFINTIDYKHSYVFSWDTLMTIMYLFIRHIVSRHQHQPTTIHVLFFYRYWQIYVRRSWFVPMPYIKRTYWRFLQTIWINMLVHMLIVHGIYLAYWSIWLMNQATFFEHYRNVYVKHVTCLAEKNKRDLVSYRF